MPAGSREKRKGGERSSELSRQRKKNVGDGTWGRTPGILAVGINASNTNGKVYTPEVLMVLRGGIPMQKRGQSYILCPQ